ncbi:MAG TPA: prephenate dehydratase domain-containing protein [Gemmatimonadaceae bacterium]|nr:prephenate dehydratase domain-containing protein [Gemmatimonadaceae bacterium]
MPVRVAFQGAPGAFGEEAVVRHFGPTAQPLPSATMGDVVRAVEGGSADAGVLPVANAIAGPVRDALDAVAAGAVRVVGEVTVPVRLALLALPGARLAGLRSVASHPVALAQCGTFLAAHPRLLPRPAWDTAGAARDVATAADPTAGAIAAAQAAARYGLVVLADGIQDRENNVTTFVVVERSATR